MAVPSLDVAFMIGHDDDIVLDQRVGRRGRQCSSRWAGLQSDTAIVHAIQTFFPTLRTATLSTVEELRATEAAMIVVLSYKTQPSYAWYATFFDVLGELEARGVTVYPCHSFKKLISSKAEYMRVLQSAGLPLCPTAVLDRTDCFDAATGALSEARIEDALRSALRSLHMLPSAQAAAGVATEEDGGIPQDSQPVRMVTKPSNADGGFGVAFWDMPLGTAYRATAMAVAPSTNAAAARDTAVVPHGCDREPPVLMPGLASNPAPPASTTLVRSMNLRMLLSNGCDIDEIQADPPQTSDALQALGKRQAPSGTPSVPTVDKRRRRSTQPGTATTSVTPLGPGADASAADAGPRVAGAMARKSAASIFLEYLERVGFVGSRPYVLIQPLVPLLAQHFELKI